MQTIKQKKKDEAKECGTDILGQKMQKQKGACSAMLLFLCRDANIQTPIKRSFYAKQTSHR